MKIVKDKIELDDLSEFIVKAKVNSYASGLKAKKLEDGSNEFMYNENGWEYRDKYFGFDPFVGQEVVSKNGKVIWVMNYCGKILKDIVSADEIYTFLKKALSKVEKLIPFRGPEKLEEENFKYRHISGGYLDHFHGVEMILYKGERVYELIYDGGLIKD